MLKATRPTLKNKRMVLGALCLALLCSAIAAGFANRRLSRLKAGAKASAPLNVATEPQRTLELPGAPQPQINAQADLSPSVIAGGGGSSSAASFKIEGTIGQPAAGIEMSGGQFSQTGGFWQVQSAATSTPTPSPTPSPTASPTPGASPTPTPSPTPPTQSIVLTTDQVTLNSWKYQGRHYAYVKLTFPDAGYHVADWGQPLKSANDFSSNASIERFTGPSVLAETTTAQIYDLGILADGSYTFTFKNSSVAVKALMFTVSSVRPAANSIDTAREFVRQQYRDFLNREADQAGEDFWTDNITKCSDPARRPLGQTIEQCTLRQMETTSGAFFLSPEFQSTGYYVYRMYQGALGRQPKLSEFRPDAQFVGAGILVNGQLSGAKINQNKADFVQQFVNCVDPTKYRCAEFKAKHDGLSNQQYVDKLFQSTGVNPNASDRAALVNELNGGTESRATVLQKVVDGINVISEGNQQFTTSYGQAFYDAESNRAFVQLEYFGYMKRDPDEAGYAFWLGKLNQFGGDFVKAEMVLAFISSPEYRARFGAP
jgi:hypothetical protein